MTDDEIKVWVTNATSALSKLEKDLRKPLLLFKKGLFVEAKAKNVTDKVANVVKQLAVFRTLVAAKDFAALSAQSQADVNWVEGILTSLEGCNVEVVKMKRIYKKPPEPQMKIILRHGKAYFARVKTQPKGISILLKQLQREEPVSGPEKDSLGFMPLVVLLWKTADHLLIGLNGRPKVTA